MTAWGYNMKNNHKLSLQNISFAFNKNAPLFFDNLSYEFQAGTLHFIKGVNGIGKSTLFRIILGNIQKEEFFSGQIFALTGNHPHNQTTSQDKRKLLSYVPQKSNLLLADQFTAQENILLASLPRYPVFKFFKQNAQNILYQPLFGFNPETPVHKFSGGQQQLLAIITKLQSNPRILLLDEPTASLDAKNAQIVMNFLTRLVYETGLTVLIISHDQELVANYALGYHELCVNNGQSRYLIWKKS